MVGTTRKRKNQEEREGEPLPRGNQRQVSRKTTTDSEGEEEDLSIGNRRQVPRRITTYSEEEEEELSDGSEKQVSQKQTADSEEEEEPITNSTNERAETDDMLEENGTEELERRRSEEFLKRYDCTSIKRNLDEVERMPLEMWHSQLFQSCKYITDQMLVDESGSKSIMRIAFEKMKLYTEEQRKQKREAIKRFLKMKVGKARDFFQQGVRKAIIALGK